MSDTQTNSLAERLAARFGDLLKITVANGQTTAEVDAAHLLPVATSLRDEPGFRFSELVDLCGVDYLGYGQTEWDTTDVSGNGFSRGVEGEAVGRFAWQDRPRDVSMPKRYASVFHLLSIELNQRLRVRVFCDDNDLPVLPSLTSIWPGVNWFEREAFDLFGIIYEGHPDLRRILTDYGFVGHPFRKDFPLIGNVEVRFDEKLGRVIYEPVTSVEPRVLVPRVIRHDSRWEQAQAEAAAEAKK